MVQGGIKADAPSSIQSRRGLTLPFSLVPYPLNLPAGLLESVYTKHRAERVSVFSGVCKLFLSFLGSKDYQLVTWSRDQTLRMWRIDSQLQRVRKHFCS